MEYKLDIEDAALAQLQALAETTGHENIGELITTALGTFSSLVELTRNLNERERLGLYNTELRSFVPITIVSLAETLPAKEAEKPKLRLV